MKKRRILAILMTLVIALAVPGASLEAKAAGAASLVDQTASVIQAIPGETVHVRLPITSKNNSYITMPKITVTSETEGTITAANIKLLSEQGKEIQYIPNTGEVYLEFDMSTKASATIGMYKLSINVTYTDYFTLDEYGNAAEVTDVIELKASVTQEKVPIQLTVSDVTYLKDQVLEGKRFNLSFQIKNEGEIDAYGVYYSLGFTGTDMIPGYSADKIQLGNLSAGKNDTVTVPVEVLANATAGMKTISVTLECKDIEGNAMSFTRSIYVTVKNKDEIVTDVAKLQLSAETFNAAVKAGTEAELGVILNNIGGSTAKNIVVSLKDGYGTEYGIIPRYTAEGVKTTDLEKNGETIVKIPLLISETAPAGLRSIILQAAYADADGTERTTEVVIYITVENEKTEEERLVNEILINNVVQSPKKPEAGQEVSVSFDIQNKGNKAVTGVKLSGENLSGSGFEPLTSEPYQNVGTIEAGKSKNVTMTFKVGKDIPEGLNRLGITCSYKDNAGEVHSETTYVYILDVVNNGDTGKPKLILDDFSTDEEVLTAGSLFNFMFTLQNTHATKAAKNIKVTITQDENIFSPATGTNSFYIQNIAAGEEAECAMELKVRADATTGAYDVNILVEYEYDDMSKTDTDNGGVSETNKVKLTAIENARPVVENINIYDSYTYDTPTVGSTCSLNFEFYNMGRSSLNNVYITVEGDFRLANGSMHYIGTVGNGSAEYVEPEIVPVNAGSVVCTIVVHFEDSNGNEVTKATDYNTYVQEAGNSYDDPGYDDPGNYEPVGPTYTAKEPIMSIWLFLAIQAGILIIFIPVTRAIVIAVHKAKLRKQEDEN